MPVIGVAEVEVKPTFSGVQRTVGRELSGIATVEGTKAGRSMGSRLGGALATTAKVGAGVAAAGIGVALTKGFGRLQAIENARAKLTGLGHSAKGVETIMGNALSAVKGTAFGLDEAATVAANAVAAGVKPGADLERTLKLVGDAATIAGTDMGSMGAIFNKAAASNKVQMDVINQLHDTGVPALALLADEMGVTAEAASVMASKGEIDFATFQRAMEKGMSGAALAGGDTLSGAYKNTMAAVGRIGANLLTGVYPLFTKFFQNMIVWLEPLEAGAKVAGVAIGDWLGGAVTKLGSALKAIDFSSWSGFTASLGKVGGGAFSSIGDSLKTLMPAFKEFGAQLKEMGPAAAKVASFGLAVLTGALGFLADNVDTIIAWMPAIVAGFIAWRIAQSALAHGTMSMQAAQLAMTPVITLNNVLRLTAIRLENQQTKALMASTLAQGQNNAAQNLGIVARTKLGLATVAQRVSTVAATAVTWAQVAAQKALNVVMNANPFMKIVALIGILVGAVVWLYKNNETARKIIDGAWKGIQTAVQWAWQNVIKPAFDWIAGFVKNTLGPIFQWLYKNIIQPVWTAISTAVKIAWAIIETIFLVIKWYIDKVLAPTFKWLYNTIIKPVFDAIGAAIKWAWNNVIMPIFAAVKWYIDNILAPVFRWLRDKVIKPVWDGISKTVKDVWNNNIKPIFVALGDFIEDKVAPAFKRGVQAIKDIWNGIRNAAAAPINFVIDTVYNNGLRKALNKVRKVVGGDELPPLAKIPEFGQKRSTSGGPMRAFAKGGFAAPGWALVGEEGPELVNFSNPGRVYTADQSRKMLGAGHGPALPAMGGFAADAWDAIKAGVKKATDWVRGGLASAAGLLLNPIKNGLGALLPKTGLGDIAKRASSSVIDGALDWIRGKDKETMPSGSTAAVYDGPLGAFHRPSRGPYTSFFGPRPGFGDYHTGVDIAGGGPTFAALNGIVSQIGNDPVGGIFIRLNHGKGFSTYYGHNPIGGPKVNVGQQVKAGQTIGAQGMTGLATGVHVHFQTERGGRPVDPMAYLHDNGGVLNPGLSTILNRTGKPEAILNNQQWNDIHRLAMARNAPAGSAGVTVNGDVYGANAHQIYDVLETKRRREMAMANISQGMRF